MVKWVLWYYLYMKNFCIFLILIFFISLAFYYFNYKSTSIDLEKIKERGTLLVGTTGDYCPMSCYDVKSKTYIGFDIALAEDLAKSLGVNIEYVPTSWPSLMSDVINKKFDVAISGITITKSRKKQALMTKGYLDNGKTILCRKDDVGKYTTLDSINKSDVRVMENPGGLNEKFAREFLPNSTLIIHNVNYEIPQLVASGNADVMITEVIEANYYSHINENLAAPLYVVPFTKSEIGMLLPKDNKQLLKYVNNFIDQEKRNGRITELKNIYLNSNKPLANYK